MTNMKKTTGIPMRYGWSTYITTKSTIDSLIHSLIIDSLIDSLAEWSQFVVDYLLESLTYFAGVFRSSKISHWPTVQCCSNGLLLTQTYL